MNLAALILSIIALIISLSAVRPMLRRKAPEPPVTEAERTRAFDYSVAEVRGTNRNGRCVCDDCIRYYWRPLWRAK